MRFHRKVAGVTNALTCAHYTLRALDEISLTDAQVGRVRCICNEDEIYRWLFAARLKGQLYSREMAAEWFRWGAKGWREASHFAFAALDMNGLVAAACDIKDADAASAEIGYWCSAAHRGLMTNAVSTMLMLGKEAGFKEFYADAKPLNVRSQGVVRRLGFSLDTTMPAASVHLRYRSPQTSVA